MTVPLFDDSYAGPRFRYGLRDRPLGYGRVPAGWLIGSDRRHLEYRHGTVAYPRRLTPEEVAGYQLEEVG